VNGRAVVELRLDTQVEPGRKCRYQGGGVCLAPAVVSITSRIIEFGEGPPEEDHGEMCAEHLIFTLTGTAAIITEVFDDVDPEWEKHDDPTELGAPRMDAVERVTNGAGKVIAEREFIL